MYIIHHKINSVVYNAFMLIEKNILFQFHNFIYVKRVYLLSFNFFFQERI